MRRYQKKQLLEKFNILQDAHSYIEELMQKEQDASQMLSDCQGVAIEIGTEIENIEGEGTRTVALLEDYCEVLYHISERKFPVSPSHMAARTKEELDAQLRFVEESLQKDIKEQSVVVFFPYKASMWDSMETIWRNYQQDKSVQTMVVALPYSVKDKEGKKVRSCYEGKDFPKDVQIINYEDFLESKCYADIAIYHNPYDDKNKITEVDSRFFSSVMHDYAHTLVYIPYYVLFEKPEVSLILLPGVKNADYVILQDEEIMEEFLRWYPKEKDKFLPLGSPKIDKAIEMNTLSKEDIDIPKEWKDRIRGKKVLFYNTHLVNFFDENRDFIGKLKEVFRIMQAQDEVVLWWRPHPLSDDMEFTTKQKERFAEYEELVNWYQRENIGIYDDTPKLHEAIVAADAYYGDMSSVVKLFRAVGKPVMLQRAEHLKKIIFGTNMLQEYQDVTIELDGVHYTKQISCSCIVNKTLWCVTYYNVLYAIDLANKQTITIGMLPNVEPTDYYAFCKMVYINEHLVMLPYYSRGIVSYSLKDGTYKVCSMEVEEKYVFYTAEVYEDKLYMPSIMKNEIYSYSVIDNYCQKVIDYKWIADKEKKYGIIFQSTKLAEKIYLLVDDSNLVVQYDMKRNTIDVIEQLQTLEHNYIALTRVDQELFLLSLQDSCIDILDLSTNQLKEVTIDDWNRTDLTMGNFYRKGHKLNCYFDSHDEIIELDLQMKKACKKKNYSKNDTDIVLNDNLLIKELISSIVKKKILKENGDFNLKNYLNLNEFRIDS